MAASGENVEDFFLDFVHCLIYLLVNSDAISYYMTFKEVKSLCSSHYVTSCPVPGILTPIFS